MDWVEEFFDNAFYARDYDVVDKDLERTAREVEFIVAELGLNTEDHVLDLACGAGRHALAIAQHVAHITGVDRTATCIEKAQRTAADGRISNAEFLVGDMRELEEQARYSAAYNYFTAWGYYDFDTNIDILRRVHRALKPGGCFMLEMINRDAVMATWRPRDYTIADDGTITLYERRFDFATGRAHSKYTHIQGNEQSSIEIDHYMPSSDALVRHFQDVGFKDVRLIAAPLAESNLRDAPKVLLRSATEVTLMNRRIAVVGCV